jgi:hypothetical protein
MAKKPEKSRAAGKPARAARPAAKAAKSARPTKPVMTEHRVAVSGVALHVHHGRGRREELELRGTAALNVGAPESVVRTTGAVLLTTGRAASALTYSPASLNRNLVLRLTVDQDDLDLLRSIFVTGTGSELSDPALTVWAVTEGLLAPDSSAEMPVVEFGYSLDFDPGPPGVLR